MKIIVLINLVLLSSFDFVEESEFGKVDFEHLNKRVFIYNFEINFQTVYSKIDRKNRKTYRYFVGLNPKDSVLNNFADKLLDTYFTSLKKNKFYKAEISDIDNLSKYEEYQVIDGSSIYNSKTPGFLILKPNYKRLFNQNENKLEELLNSKIPHDIALQNNIILCNIYLEFTFLEPDNYDNILESLNERRLANKLTTNLKLTKNSQMEFLLPYGKITYQMNQNFPIFNAIEDRILKPLSNLPESNKELNSLRYFLDTKSAKQLTLIELYSDSLIKKSMINVEEFLDSSLARFQKKYR